MVLTPQKARDMALKGLPKTLIRISNTKKIAIEKYMIFPKLCKQCLSIIPYKKRYNDFCSHKCASIFHKLGGHTRGNINNSSIICPLCHKKKQYKSKICIQCTKIKNQNIFVNNLKKRGYMKSNTLRTHYEKIRDHKCEQCGIESWNNLPITLHAHHIDGNVFNNDSSNIMILCPNCHSQTPNYCARNKGNGKFKVIKTLKSY